MRNPVSWLSDRAFLGASETGFLLGISQKFLLKTLETRFLGWLSKVEGAVSAAMPSLGLSHFSWMGDRELNPDCINI